MKKVAILIPAISLLLFSCGNTSNEKSKEQSETVSNKESLHNHEIQTINLNKGEKWLVEPTMLSLIRKMEREVLDFDQQSFTQLGHQLSSDVEELTSNCTMTGLAHDELHKWLLPYIDLVDSLTQTNDQKEARALYQQIKQSFHTFNQYFK